MPNYIRRRVRGGTYFFTICLADRASSVLTERIEDLRAAFREVKSRRPFAIRAATILPDHLHTVWTLPPGDSDYSTRIGALKSHFTRRCRRAGFTPPPLSASVRGGGVNPALRRKGEVGLWQPRFWEHTIRSDADFWHHMRYCAWNPVKHGYVDDPLAWPFSSIHGQDIWWRP